jgi:hypothetical protein
MRANFMTTNMPIELTPCNYTRPAILLTNVPAMKNSEYDATIGSMGNPIGGEFNGENGMSVKVSAQLKIYLELWIENLKNSPHFGSIGNLIDMKMNDIVRNGY